MLISCVGVFFTVAGNSEQSRDVAEHDKQQDQGSRVGRVLEGESSLKAMCRSQRYVWKEVAGRSNATPRNHRSGERGK
jgi:hypothetical protein